MKNRDARVLITDQPSAEVIVTRKVRDGWFVYTCDQLPGLYVAHQDDRTAYDDIPESIRMLIKLNDGIECQVSHAVSYAEFVNLTPIDKDA